MAYTGIWETELNDFSTVAAHGSLSEHRAQMKQDTVMFNLYL